MAMDNLANILNPFYFFLVKEVIYGEILTLAPKICNRKGFISSPGSACETEHDIEEELDCCLHL